MSGSTDEDKVVRLALLLFCQERFRWNRDGKCGYAGSMSKGMRIRLRDTGFESHFP